MTEQIRIGFQLAMRTIDDNTKALETIEMTRQARFMAQWQIERNNAAVKELQKLFDRLD